MATAFNQYRDVVCFTNICNAMQTKFQKYWKETPMIFFIAAPFYPRINLSGVEMLIDDIKGFLKTSLDVTMEEVQEFFNQIFFWYNLKYGPSNTSTSASTHNENSSGDGQYGQKKCLEPIGK
ncbi:hypothetical protein Ddye_020941 [Dipteronia dyeriana]|uniref:hAT-like transposase RNase-H fold domain-containing protein n=1 Tax=Dipteronia dyeriana TaxID=168575 RepID=A0AAD9U0Q4_9ROSI|nr:hypothetical protein Ddye_020941 [Dipteronia dyeriana]